MEFIFLNPAGQTLFVRDDMESGHLVQQEMNITADFPFVADKKIERGMRIAFRSPVDDALQVFEVRIVTNQEPEHYQQITAEHIALSELSDEHINTTEVEDKTAAQALATALTGTLWSVGNNTASGTQSADFSRGSVWDAVNTIQQNWNVYITPRIVISSAGAITGRYLDIAPAEGVWRGVRLSVRKNMLDPAVTYDDEDVYTALYGYGGNVEVPQTTGDDETEELTFADEVWSATSDHPAKPSGQTYLEWPEKTALYGRNGRARFGYYQNGSIKDASVLLEKTWESLKQCAEPKISITGTVVDLYRLGYHDEPIQLHDTAIVEIEETGETFNKQIICCDIDLIDPTGSRVEIGDYIQNIIYINREIAKKASGGGGGGGGRGMTKLEDEDSKYETWFEKTDRLIGMFAGIKDGDGYLKVGEICLAINDSDDILANIKADHINISATQTAHMLAGSIVYDDQGRLILKESSGGGVYVEHNDGQTTATFGVWDRGNLTGGVMVDKINEQTTTYITGDKINISATDTVQTIAGAMEKDANGNLIIKDGAGFRARVGQAEFGIYNENNLTAGVIVGKVNDSSGQTLATINADHINVSGTSTVSTLAGQMETDASGKLIIKSAGGMYVQREESGTTVQVGVWDKGNLTGGVMVQEINGQTGTYITGDKINISSTSSVATLAGEMEVDANGNLVVKDGAGFKARIGQAEFGIYNENNLTAGVIVGKVNDSSGQTLATINADHINVSGTSTVSTLAGQMETDASGKLIIKSAGGMYVQRNEGGTTVQVGVWDKGNLTGGVMVQQINGQTGTKLTLQADVIDINGVITALQSKAISCGNLDVQGTIDATGTIYSEVNLYAEGNVICNGKIVADSFEASGTNHAISWKSQTVVTSVSASNEHSFLYGGADLEPTGRATGRVLLSTPSTTTIHYLGY